MFKNLATLREENGITLIELMVYMALLVIIFIGAYTIYEVANTMYVSASGQADAQISGRVAQASMTKHIRMSESFAEAGDYSIDIRVDVDDDGLWDRVQYYLDGENLYRKINDDEQKLIAGGVRNHTIGKPIFTYYDMHGDEVTDISSRITKTNMMEIDLTIDGNPGKPPAAYTLSSKVTLRNNN